MPRALLPFFFCCALLCGCAGRAEPEAGTVPVSEPAVSEPAARAFAPGPADGGPAAPDDVSYDEFADLFAGDDAAFAPEPDPFEGWNRFWFGFNDIALRHVIKPLYKGWEFVAPREVRSGISNFFHNLAMPIRFINCLLQGKFNDAGVEVSAFIINTVVGLGGAVNVADRHEEVRALDDEDFGQTLGAWGVGEGPYLVWPLLGPSNLRDTVGLGGDFFMNPLFYMDADPYPLIGTGVNTFNSMGDRISAYEAITDAAIEPYSALRDAYSQHRRARVKK